MTVLTDTGSPESTIVSATTAWESLTTQATSEVTRYQEAHPLRPGMPREELRRALRLRQNAFAAGIEHWQAEGVLVIEADRVRTPEWNARIAGEARATADAWLARLRGEGANGITRAELVGEGKDDLLAALTTDGGIRRLPEDILMAGDVYSGAVSTIIEMLRAQPGITVAQVRDALGSNRRATLALLAELDSQGITCREGDLRVPGRRFTDLGG